MAGVVGFAMRLLRIPFLPTVLGLVLGYLVESNYRRALVISGGDHSIFLEDPISLGLSRRRPPVHRRLARQVAARGQEAPHEAGDMSMARGDTMHDAGGAATLSERLAAWGADLSPATLPAGMVAKTEAILVDVVGLCLAARHTDYVRSVLEVAERGRHVAIGHDTGSPPPMPRSSTARPPTARTSTTPSRAARSIPVR